MILVPTAIIFFQVGISPLTSHVTHLNVIQFLLLRSISFVSNIFLMSCLILMALMKNRKKRRWKSNSIERNDKISQSIRNWTNMTFEILMVFIFSILLCALSVTERERRGKFLKFSVSIFSALKVFFPSRFRLWKATFEDTRKLVMVNEGWMICRTLSWVDLRESDWCQVLMIQEITKDEEAKINH